MNRLIYLFGVLILLSACSKDEDFSGETNYYTEWESHPEVKFDKVYLQNGFATEDKMYIVGSNHFLTFNENHELESEYLISETAVNIGLGNIPTITENVFGYKDNDWYTPQTLTLHSTKNPSLKTTIDFNTIDTGFNYINTYYNNNFVVTDDNILIVPCQDKHYGNNRESKIALYFFQLTVDNTTLEYNFLKKLIHIVPFSPETFTNIFLRDEMLYFGYVETYSLNLQTEVFKNISAIYYPYPAQVQDTFFIVGPAERFNLSFDYTLNNQDFSINQFDYYDNGFMRFTSVEDVIVGYRSGAINTFQLNGNTLFFNGVNTEDIYQKFDIEKIVIFKDRVYLIGRNGLYSKNINSFFQTF